MMKVRPHLLLRWLNILLLLQLLLGMDGVWLLDCWYLQVLIEGLPRLGELLALNSCMRNVFSYRFQFTIYFFCCLGILPFCGLVSSAILLLQRYVHLFSQEPLVMLVNYTACLIYLRHAWGNSTTHDLVLCSHIILRFEFWCLWMQGLSLLSLRTSLLLSGLHLFQLTLI